MEKATEALMREGLRKERDCPWLDVESQQLAHEEKSQQILARLDAVWDDLEKSYGAQPVRRDAEHTESKEFWRKMDLATASQEAAAAWSDDDEDYDDPDRAALRFRKQWNYIWSGECGSFEDTTLIPPMRYTDEDAIQTIYPCDTLQIFSAKIAGIGGCFQWPLDVFGLVAIRDSIDQNRNIIFQHSRVEYQTLTEEEPYLVLTGPSRAVVLVDPVTIEVYLKVKGPTELEDKTLCFLANEIKDPSLVHSCLLHETWTSKFSMLEFVLGHIVHSVEATIYVRVVDGSWPDGFRGQFDARMVSTSGTRGMDHDECGPRTGRSTSLNDSRIVLLSFDDKVPVSSDGVIELSRRVVSAEVKSMLIVSVNARQDNNIVEASVKFRAKKAGRNFGVLAIGSCKIAVTIAWSLISDDPEHRGWS